MAKAKTIRVKATEILYLHNRRYYPGDVLVVTPKQFSDVCMEKIPIREQNFPDDHAGDSSRGSDESLNTTDASAAQADASLDVIS